MKRVFIIKGRKWWDKVNGNTYNSAWSGEHGSWIITELKVKPCRTSR